MFKASAAHFSAFDFFSYLFNAIVKSFLRRLLKLLCFVLCFTSVLDVSHSDADDMVCYLAVDIVASSDLFVVHHFF